MLAFSLIKFVFNEHQNTNFHLTAVVTKNEGSRAPLKSGQFARKKERDIRFMAQNHDFTLDDIIYTQCHLLIFVYLVVNAVTYAHSVNIGPNSHKIDCVYGHEWRLLLPCKSFLTQ